jgi:hypothetical protein
MEFVDVLEELSRRFKSGDVAPTAGAGRLCFGKLRPHVNLLDIGDNSPQEILVLCGMDDFFRYTQEFWDGTARETLELDSSVPTWNWLTLNGTPIEWRSKNPAEKSAVFQLVRGKCLRIKTTIMTLLDGIQNSRSLQYLLINDLVGPVSDIKIKRCKALQKGVKEHIEFLQDLKSRLDIMLVETIEGRDVSTFNWTSSAVPREGPSHVMGSNALNLQEMHLLLETLKNT